MSQTVRLLLVLEVLGLLGSPLAARALSRLPGAGAGLGRVLALLLLGWGVWLAGSLGIPNGPVLLGGGVLVLAAGAAAARRRGPRAPAPDPFRRRLTLATELLFAGAVLAAALLVSFSPDVWGTEKPMDMALTNATIVADHFPPHDPWLAGDQLNYYYLGHLMAGLLIRLTGVEPSQGYNLALAATFALVVTAAFAVAAALAETGRRQGLPVRRPLLAGAAAVVLLALMGNLRGGWEALHAGPLQSFDWFSPSRVVPGTINEFPAFSFAVGDLHAHLLAVPLTLLALAFVVQVAMSGPPRGGGWWTTGCAALSLGILYTVNAWSWPVTTGLMLAALAGWAATPAGRRRRGRAAVWGGLVVVGGLVLVAPFVVHFDPNAGGLAVVATATREPLGRFLGHHAVMEGALLWLLLVPLALQARRAPRVAAAAAAATVALAVVLAGARLGGAALLTGVAVAALALALARDRPPAERLVWLLVATGVACLAVPEVVSVRDEFAGTPFVRMNTVFKLGYQAWLLLAIAGGVVVAAAPRWLPQRVPRAGWLGVAGVLVVVGLAYPVGAAVGRTDGFARSPTLEGRGWLAGSAPGDLYAIDWLRGHVPGDAVLAEAVGDDYSVAGNGRMSTYTGRPAVLGWQGHELQWSHDVGTRRQDLAVLYRTRDPGRARRVVRRYGIDYVVVGPLERATYGRIGAVRGLGRRVFTRAGTSVYAV